MIQRLKSNCFYCLQASESFSQTASSIKLPNQQCLLTSISEHAQHTLNSVVNLVFLPLDTLLALLSVTCNTVILVAILRTRSTRGRSQEEEYPAEKNVSEQRRGPTINSTHMITMSPGIEPRVTLVGGEYSHHYTNPTPQESLHMQILCKLFQPTLIR